MTERAQQRLVNHRPAVLHHAEEVTGDVAHTGRYFGITRQTYYRWLRRYEETGVEGLRDRSPRPHHSPNATSAEVVGKIIYLRQSYLLQKLPFRVEVIQTDNGAEFGSQFHVHVLDRWIRHVYFKPATPPLNGKVERSHRIDEAEF